MRIPTRQRLVIRDGATWAKVWKQFADTHQPIAAIPVIDFAKSVVIVAAMGIQSSGGYTITVDDVRIIAGGARISITEKSPGKGCIVTMAMTEPASVVLVPRFAGEAVFVEHTSQYDCE